MATSAQTVDFFLEQAAESGVTARKMFGEYGIFAEGRMVAMLCDDALFVRPLPEAAAWIGAPEEGLPYPGAKPQFRIAPDLWEDRDWLAGLMRVMAAALPPAKPRKPRKPRP